MSGLNRFGPYVLGQFNKTEPYIAQWKPSWLVLHDGEAKMENVNKVRELSPDTKIIGRWYQPDSWFNDKIRSNPTQAAEEVAAGLFATDWAANVDAIITSNEVCQDWAGLPFLNDFYLALQDFVPFPLILASFSVENPGWSNSDPDGWHASLMKHWQLFEPAMRKGLEHGDYLGIHQYNANRVTLGDYQEMRAKISREELGTSIKNSSDTLNMLPEEIKSDLRRIFRYEVLVWPYLDSGIQQLPIIVSEFGWDFLLWPYNYKAGWLEDIAAISTEDANGQLSWFAGLWDDAFTGEVPVKGWVLYGSGDSGSWHNYDITSVDMPNGEKRARPLIQEITNTNVGGDFPRDYTPEPPDPPVPPQDFEDAIRSAADESQCIYLNPDAAIQKQIVADGFTPVGGETDFTYDMVPYVIQKAENMTTGAARVYYALKPYYDYVSWVDYPV